MSAAGIVGALARASLQGALFIAVVWLVCRLFPRLPAAVRCGLWWAACLKLLVGLVWVSPVRLPLLPAEDAPAVESGALFHIRNVAAVAASPAPGRVGPPTRRPDLPLPEALVTVWLAGLLLVAARSVRQLRHTWWMIRRSEPVREGWIRAAFAELCGRLALRRPPALLGSADVKTPQAVGLLRPRVVLPQPGLERLSAPEVAMTLCHELLHLRRGDLWLGWVPALAQRIFFFHPLAALAAREYAIAREAACDAEVLHVLGTAPQAYGRLLLRWGVAPRETGLAAAGASPSLKNLKRRLQMLQQTSENKRRLSGWWWVAGALVLAGLIPLQIVAQEQTPEPPEAVVAPEPPEAAVTPEVAEAPEPPEATVAPEAAIAPTPAVAAAPAAPATMPTPAVAPVPTPQPPAAAIAPAPPSGAIPGGVEGGIAGGVAGGIPGGIAGGVKGGIPGGVAGAIPGTPAALAVPTPRPALAPVPPPRPRGRGPAGTPPPGRAPVATPPPGRGPAGTPPPRALAPVAATPVARAVPAVAPVAAPGYASTPQPPPPPPAPPKPPKPPKSSGYWYQTGDKDSDSWIVMYGNDSVTMSGSTRDLDKVRRLRGDAKEGILWFRHGGKEYVVRDPATVKQAQEIFKPQMELGARQGALGAKQGELGGRQGALGAKQGALGAQQAALAAERVSRGGDADDKDLEARERDLERQQEELGRQQEELGRQQEALGRQQEELGRQQEAAGRRAEKEFRALMDRAIASGVAQEVR